MIEVKRRAQQLDIEHADLRGSRVENADLSLLTINNCNIAGLRIDGIEIAPLLAQRKTTHG